MSHSITIVDICIPTPPSQILEDCLPDGVYETYVSNAKGTPDHHHKSLIVNLACGASVSMDGARSELLDG